MTFSYFSKTKIFQGYVWPQTFFSNFLKRARSLDFVMNEIWPETMCQSGREPWSSGHGRRLNSEGRVFESTLYSTDIFHIIFYKIV